MLKKEMYELLLEIRKEVNEYLKKIDEVGLEDLLLYLTRSKEYIRLCMHDNQLFMLNQFCFIWKNEKVKLLKNNIYEDIFSNIHSLDDVQFRYNSIKYAALRIENNLPYEMCSDAIDVLVDAGISGIAMGVIICSDTQEKKHNMIKMAELLEQKGQQDKAVMLLEYGISKGIFS